MARQRRKNAEAAARMQEIERSTAARNRVSLAMMQNLYANAAAMNKYRIEAAAIKARQQAELATLKERFQSEARSLVKRHEIEKKTHAAEVTRFQKMQKAKRDAMSKIVKKLRNA